MCPITDLIFSKGYKKKTFQGLVVYTNIKKKKEREKGNLLDKVKVDLNWLHSLQELIVVMKSSINLLEIS